MICQRLPSGHSDAHRSMRNAASGELSGPDGHNVVLVLSVEERGSRSERGRGEDCARLIVAVVAVTV